MDRIDSYNPITNSNESPPPSSKVDDEVRDEKIDLKDVISSR